MPACLNEVSAIVKEALEKTKTTQCIQDIKLILIEREIRLLVYLCNSQFFAEIISFLVSLFLFFDHIHIFFDILERVSQTT